MLVMCVCVRVGWVCMVVMWYCDVTATLRLQASKKDDEVAVPVCAQEHERYCPTPPPPHHTPPVTDHEWAVPVSAGQQERW